MAEVYNVQMRYNWLGLTNMITLNYLGPDNYEEVFEFGEELGQLFVDFLAQGAIPTGFSFVQLYVKSRQNQGPGVLIRPSMWPHAGSVASDTLGVTGVCNYTFSAPAPNYPTRGLVQWPYVFEVWQTNGSILESNFASVTSFVVLLASQLFQTSSTEWRPGLYSAKYDNYKPIQSVTIAERWTRNLKKLKGL